MLKIIINKHYVLLNEKNNELNLVINVKTND